MSVSTATRKWTLEELHGLPDDGNRYELVHGELLVTPAPTAVHETILARLSRILDRFVEAQGLGLVYRPRSVIRRRPRSEVEPDLYVSAEIVDYDAAPIPMLVVEVLSPYTRRRDESIKRAYYLDEVGVPEYWMIDPDAGTLRVARRAGPDVTYEGMMVWAPPASDSLSFDVRDLFPSRTP